jgi:hypothetical protein
MAPMRLGAPTWPHAPDARDAAAELGRSSMTVEILRAEGEGSL